MRGGEKMEKGKGQKKKKVWRERLKNGRQGKVRRKGRGKTCRQCMQRKVGARGEEENKREQEKETDLKSISSGRKGGRKRKKE